MVSNKPLIIKYGAIMLIIIFKVVSKKNAFKTTSLKFLFVEFQDFEYPLGMFLLLYNKSTWIDLPMIML